MKLHASSYRFNERITASGDIQRRPRNGSTDVVSGAFHVDGRGKTHLMTFCFAVREATDSGMASRKSWLHNSLGFDSDLVWASPVAAFIVH